MSGTTNIQIWYSYACLKYVFLHTYARKNICTYVLWSQHFGIKGKKTWIKHATCPSSMHSLQKRGPASSEVRAVTYFYLLFFVDRRLAGAGCSTKVVFLRILKESKKMSVYIYIYIYKVKHIYIYTHLYACTWHSDVKSSQSSVDHCSWNHQGLIAFPASKCQWISESLTFTLATLCTVDCEIL